MAYYRVWLGDGTESYWVAANSEEQARKLVSLNVFEGDNEDELDCSLDLGMTLPEGVIVSSVGSNFTIIKT